VNPPDHTWCADITTMSPHIVRYSRPDPHLVEMMMETSHDNPESTLGWQRSNRVRVRPDRGRPRASATAELISSPRGGTPAHRCWIYCVLRENASSRSAGVIAANSAMNSSDNPVTGSAEYAGITECTT
jgi:hypothetical protein